MTLAQGEQVDVVGGARLVGSTAFGSEPVDVHLSAGRIVDIAPAGALPRRGAVLDAHGGWLVPGLWDHHVHLVQWALTAQRVPLHTAGSAAAAARLMAAAPVLPDGRRIGVGFRDALWGDTPTLDVLDAATGEVPAYLVNADLHSLWLNSAALRREGFAPDGAGVLREAPAFEVARRLNAVGDEVADRLVSQAATAAARQGVVGIVDLDMAWNEASWSRRLQAGFDQLRVRFGIYPADLDRALGAGLRTADRVRGATSDLVRVGALKVITDGSLGTRTAACSHAYPGTADHGLLTVDPADLIELMATATAAGLDCAIHAIGDVANGHALDAFAATGASGTIEHAQLVAHADIPRFARLGVAASVQPAHALDDRDLTDALWATQTAQPYPLRALADSGANLLFGSDAPVASLDVWATIAAAVFRTRDDRAPWQPDQRVGLRTALAASTGSGSAAGSEPAPGDLADLALCAADPATAGERALREMPVAATLLGGRLTHAS